MKLLLDENLPRKLKRDLAGHEVFTVRDMLWDGKENGELLALMLANDFEALISGDKNIPFEQNFQKYPIPVVVLDSVDNTYNTIRLFVPKIEGAILAGLMPGPNILTL
jgi:predicted nuclease of predicted toxin-antitoxin system